MPTVPALSFEIFMNEEELEERMQDMNDKIELDPEYRFKLFQSEHSNFDCRFGEHIFRSSAF